MTAGPAISDRLTVVLANEQERWHQTVRGLLEPMGVRTLTARSGRQAMEIIETTAVHVAVLDVGMPQLGGLQVLKLLREARAKRENADPASVRLPPAILLADDLTTHLLHEALGMKVFSVLAKPVDYGLLLDALARAVRRFYENQWPGGREWPVTSG
jgi:CheY-like chemotaxis protein